MNRLKDLKYIHYPETEESIFVFDHVKITCDEQVTFHQQPTWELSYIITGSGTRVIGDTIEPFYKNEIILIPPNIPHCWNFNELDTDECGKIENITFIFTDSFLLNCAETFPQLQNYVKIIRSREEAIIFEDNILIQLQGALLLMSKQTEIERIASIIQLLALIASPQYPHHVGKAVNQDKNIKRMQKILLYIMNEYKNLITLNDMARLVGLDKSSFCIFFKKMTGKTFFSYLTEYRIGSSCQMLTTTNIAIWEIAFASGFNDVPYYNRIFKKLKNCTPAEYRKMQV